MTPEQEERLIASWEAIALGLGALNETARSAISKQWPEARQPRDANITRIPTAEDRIKKNSGNSDGPVDEWLGEFDTEEEIGPREREFLAAQAKQSKFVASPQKASKARRPTSTGS